MYAPNNNNHPHRTGQGLDLGRHCRSATQEEGMNSKAQLHIVSCTNIFISELSEEMKCQRYASKRCACVQQSEAELMVMQPSIQGISELCLHNPFNTI